MKVETGHDSTTVSVAETEYAPCACSPLGKLYRTARPHAPGDPKQWTTYTYDASGRTLTVKLPDNSTTQYAYTGNTTMVTDPAGKWKKQTTDAFGNLTTVTEPDPAGGADWTTTYTYDILGNLTDVAMPRPLAGGGTYPQVRQFRYNGTRLVSEMNPETGTITYGYDSNGRLSSKTNARGQQSTYTYDSLGRVTHRGGVKESIDYHYDTNPVDGAFTQNGWGRLTAVEIAGPAGLYGANINLKYLYSYTQTGHVTAQRMTAATSRSGASTVAMDASYGWDNEGRMTSLTGPGGTDTYAYDVMGRLSSGGATYGPAGELLTFNNVTRTYNNLGQLTRMTRTGVMDMEYRYTAGSNNGRIAQSKDYVTGEEVTYSYDSLNRLSRAETTDAAWGNAYTYDGWGNLLQKTQTKGTAPTLSMSYDPSLNMPVGATPPSGLTGVDEEDRPISGSGELGTLGAYGDFTFDQSGKKISVMWMGQDGELHCELYFHSITGQRLARYQCGTFEGTDGNGNPSTGFSVWFHDAAKHIGGQLTTWNNTGATTDRLGSIRAMDNGERYTYYPYGESHTATGSNALYAALESPHRKHDPNTGRFDRPDPLGIDAVSDNDPGTWNQFAYASGDPVNLADPEGLDCAGTDFSFNGQKVGTIGDIISTDSDVALLATAMYTESGHGAKVDAVSEEYSIGAVIMNRWQFVNQALFLSSSARGPSLNVSSWGKPGDSLESIIKNPSQFAIYTLTANGNVSLSASAQKTLNGGLSSATTSTNCNDLAWAINFAMEMWGTRDKHLLWLSDTGLVLTGFNSFSPPHASAPYEQKAGSFGDANVFYGVPTTFVSLTQERVRRSPLRPRAGDPQ
jgi:RHS repeat-associated protein